MEILSSEVLVDRRILERAPFRARRRRALERLAERRRAVERRTLERAPERARRRAVERLAARRRAVVPPFLLIEQSHAKHDW